MARAIIPEAEALIDQDIKVLDKGFVRLIDYMGGDERIVQSARVSYGSGTKSFRQDRGLIHYLLRNWHTSPFEQVQLSFHCKMPVFVARQWVRHRTARLNEISGRYSIMKDEFYLPSPEHVCVQSESNKQGRGDMLPEAEALALIESMRDDQDKSYRTYMTYLEQGVARELARTNLPLSLYTEWYWQIDLHNLFHFLRLRMDPHAQYEIRAYAEAMALCAKAVAPIAYEAFEEHHLGSITFSRAEASALGKLLGAQRSTPDASDVGLEGRALATFQEKLSKLRSTETGDQPDEPVLPSPADQSPATLLP